MKNDVLAKLQDVKVFLFDLEGVLTHADVSKEKCSELIENVCKVFNQHGLIFGIVTAHCQDEFIKKLSAIENCFVLTSTLDKVSAVDNFLESKALNYEQVFYMGDDLLDIPLLKRCAVSAAPKTARREVKRIVNYISKSEKCEDLVFEIIDSYKESQETLKRANK
jgi:3-deoxy-D-manno-octulosonate 8-phosphate phosphatase (KDO 8-P phosphatase)